MGARPGHSSRGNRLFRELDDQNDDQDNHENTKDEILLLLLFHSGDSLQWQKGDNCPKFRTFGESATGFIVPTK
jgi:hypothetical protein